MRQYKKTILASRLGVIVPLLLCTQGALAQSVSNCGDLFNQYGPYDYTNPEHFQRRLPPVEQYHFDICVQNLKGLCNVQGSDRRLGGDIGYTLRAFPNHHRALFTMIRYSVELVPKGAERMLYEPSCWFERARKFAPQDAMVVMLEGIYFRKINKLEEARLAYEEALRMAPTSAEINYNAGLLYIDLKQYDRAVELARKAYELGHPLPGLRNKLKRLGQWPDNA